MAQVISQPTSTNYFQQGSNNSKSNPGFVNTLALILILLSGIILIILIIMAGYYIQSDKGSFENIKGLMSILLPLIGTWMGTILAFYFSKENFEAANQRVKELVNQITSTDEKLQVLKAEDVMLRPQNFTLLKVKDEAEFKAMKLNDLIKKMEESQAERLPILQTTTFKFIFLIYRTTIERFIIGYTAGDIKINAAKQPQPASAKDLTVDDMFQSDYKMIKDIVDMNAKQCFMSVNTTLDKIKQAMQDNSICQDVFITKTGKKEEAVEGWITNYIIIEKAELFKKAGASI